MEEMEESSDLRTSISTDHVTIANNASSHQLMYSLNLLRQDQRFCDVTLETADGADGSGALHAHACVLASFSNMMQVVLDNRPKQRTICLKSISSRTLALCLDYIYGCEIRITRDDVSVLLRAADLLQFRTLHSHCQQVLATSSSEMIPATFHMSGVQEDLELTSTENEPTLRHAAVEPELTGAMNKSEMASTNDEPGLTDTRETEMSSVSDEPGLTGDCNGDDAVLASAGNEPSLTGDCDDATADVASAQSFDLMPQVHAHLFINTGTSNDKSDFPSQTEASSPVKTSSPEQETISATELILASGGAPSEHTNTDESQPVPAGIVHQIVKKGSNEINCYQFILKEPCSSDSEMQNVAADIKSELPDDNAVAATDVTPQPSPQIKEEEAPGITALIFCTCCAECFDSEESYAAHQAAVTGETSSADGPAADATDGATSQSETSAKDSTLCDHCGKNFASVRSLRTHRRRLLAKALKKADGDDAGASVATGDDDYLCPTCGDVVKGRQQIQAHKQSHEKRLLCDHCNQYFSGRGNLKRHLERVERNPSMRVRCYDKAQSRARRQDYVRKLRNKPWVCDVCGETSKNWGAYYRHKKTVHEQRYICRYCSKVFITPKYLQNHEQRHTKEKNFFCTVCSAGFVVKSELDEHVDRHHQSQTVACQQCARTFRTKLALSRHEREYHRKGVRKCPHCEYRGVESNLQRHLLNQHFPEQRKAWCCRVCSNKYTQKSHLDRHLMRMHQLAPTPMVPFSVNNRALLETGDDKDPSLPLAIEPVVIVSAAAAAPIAEQTTTNRTVDVIEEYPANDFLVMDGASSNVFYLDQEIHTEEISDISIAAQSCFT